MGKQNSPEFRQPLDDSVQITTASTIPPMNKSVKCETDSDSDSEDDLFTETISSVLTNNSNIVMVTRDETGSGKSDLVTQQVCLTR